MTSFLVSLTLTLFSAAGASLPRQSTAQIAITHVAVIDMVSGVPRPDTTVVIAGSHIIQVGRSDSVRVPAGAVVVDGQGKFLIPGLWDAHIHLTIVPDQDVSRDIIAPLLIAKGVTSVRDMG